MRKQRWGILGVANINQRLLPSFRRSAHAELLAIASRSKEKAQSAARADGIPRAYGSYEELLADPDIDIVYNPLPNTLHAEWTRRAADQGKHILCEKPLTPTAREAAALVEYCAGRGVRLLDGFMWPHHPRTRRIRAFIDQGGIGAVRHVQGAFTFPLPMDSSNIRLRPELAGGSLLDVGCYPVYGIRWAFGGDVPVTVFAAANYQHGVDVAMSGVLTFADGRTAGFDCGFTRPFRGWLEITGSEGVIDIPEMWLPGPQARWSVYRDGKTVEESIDGEDQILHMIDNLSRAVANGSPVQPAPQEAVKTLQVLDALAESARTGQPVRVASP